MSRQIDFRSDTVTKPNDKMRKRMAEAEVGDDVYGEDPTTNELQEKVAKLLSKEAALFVPSGTMANLISVMIHCKERGAEVLLGDKSHIYIYEQGGIAHFGSVHPRPVTNRKDGSMDVEELRSKIRDSQDVHNPRTSLVCLESAFNGRVLPMNSLKELYEFTRQHNLPLHLDGARLFNSSIALGIPPSEITKYADSVTVCLSKGLGAPAGSVMAGKREFINDATRLRKALGGGMRQVGVLAAAGLQALEEVEHTVKDDHRRARLLANGVAVLKSDLIRISLEDVETNMVMLHLPTKDLTPKCFTQLMGKCDKDGVGILVAPYGTGVVRMVVHRNITDEDINMAKEKIKAIVEVT